MAKNQVKTKSQYVTEDIALEILLDKRQNAYSIMEDIFKNTPKKTYEQVRDHFPRAFVYYKNYGGGVDAYYLCLYDERTQITYECGTDNQNHSAPMVVNRVGDGGDWAWFKVSTKCALVELDSDALDILIKKYEETHKLTSKKFDK